MTATTRLSQAVSGPSPYSTDASSGAVLGVPGSVAIRYLSARLAFPKHHPQGCGLSGKAARNC
jgi:hypothetical protein